MNKTWQVYKMDTFTSQIFLEVPLNVRPWSFFFKDLGNWPRWLGLSMMFCDCSCWFFLSLLLLNKTPSCSFLRVAPKLWFDWTHPILEVIVSGIYHRYNIDSKCSRFQVWSLKPWILDHSCRPLELTTIPRSDMSSLLQLVTHGINYY